MFSQNLNETHENYLNDELYITFHYNKNPVKIVRIHLVNFCEALSSHKETYNFLKYYIDDLAWINDTIFFLSLNINV